jgi:PAS domain S-box-containing protein
MKKSSQEKKGRESSAVPRPPAPRKKSFKKGSLLSVEKTLADGYRLIFNAVNDAIFVHDMKTGRILDINQKGCEMYGYSRDEMLRLTIEDLSASVRPYTMRSALGRIRRAAVSGKPQLFEWHAKGKLGRLFWVEVNLKRVTIGGRAKILAVARDITSRKQVETELERQRNLFRTILASTPDFLLLKDRDAIYRAVNPAFCRFVGRREDEIIGKTDFDLFPPAEAEQYRSDDAKVMESGKPRTLVEFASGEAFKKWMHVTKTPVLGHDGASVGILVSVRDITDWKLAEEDLRKHRDQLDVLVREQTVGLIAANKHLRREIDERRKTEERLRLFRSLVDHSNDAVLVADPETGLLLDINDQACGSLGYTRDEILAMRVTDIDADVTDELSWRRHSQDMKRRGTMIFESRHKRKDGSVFPVEINVRLVTIENKSYLIGLTRDITGRKRAERDLRVKESAIAASISGVAFSDFDGRLTYANDACVKMWGYEKASDALGKSVLEFWQNGEQAAEVLGVLREQGRWFGYLVAKKKDGSFFDAQLSAAVVLDNDGKPISLMASFVDMTDRNRAEEALRQNEERFRSIAETIAEVIYRLSPDGSVSYVSPSVQSVLGFTVEETVGSHFTQFVHPEDMESAVNAHRQLLEGKQIRYLYMRVLKKSGAAIYAELNVIPLVHDGHVSEIQGVIRDITERTLAVEALRKSEEKYRAVVENINEIIYRISLRDDPRNGKIEFVSGMVERIVGYPPEAFLEDPKLWLRLVHPDDLSLLYEVTRKILTDRQIGIRVYRLRLKSSSDYLWIEDKIVPEIDQDGNLIGYFGVARDITNRKKDEEVIRRNYDIQSAVNALLQISLNEQGLDNILRQALDLILSIPWLVLESKGGIFLSEDDTGTLIMKAHRGLEDYILKECASLPSGKCLCGRAALTQEVEYAATVDERHEIRYRGMPSHGHYCIPVLFSGKTIGVIALYLREGHRQDENELAFVRMFSNVLAGIIRRKKIEEDREKIIRKLEELFATVSRSRREWQDTFDTITDLIYLTDRDYNIVRANRAFATYCGLPPHEVIGKKCYKLLHHMDAPPPDCPHIRAVTRMEATLAEMVDPVKKRTLIVASYPYHSPEQELQGSISVVRDVTEERDKEMRLIMSERLAALGQMAAGIAHEINNPLAAIAGCAEGLLNRVRQERYDAGFFKNYLTIVQEEIARCKNITTSMLSFVRTTANEKKTFDLNETVLKSLELIRLQGRLKEIEVCQNLQKGMPTIYGSESELRQALLAVITNALDAMVDKGTLRIDTAADGGGAVVTISDTGPGIPAEQISKIFDPFFTTKANRGGTGLGLSIARKIISNHKGTIDVVTAAGQGTAFTITLPK